MRRILVEHARRRETKKRGGQGARYLLDTVVLTEPRAVDLIAVDDALVKLAVLDSDMMQDDIVGFAHLYLGLVLEHQKKNLSEPFLPYKFSLPLHFKGLARGYISGSVEIQCQVASI